MTPLLCPGRLSSTIFRRLLSKLKDMWFMKPPTCEASGSDSAPLAQNHVGKVTRSIPFDCIMIFKTSGQITGTSRSTARWFWTSRRGVSRSGLGGFARLDVEAEIMWCIQNKNWTYFRLCAEQKWLWFGGIGTKELVWRLESWRKICENHRTRHVPLNS